VTTQQSYNLNLAKTYLPKWGAWEVAREIICNAIDADPDYVLESSGSNHLSVRTNTVPDMSEMLIIGHGSKAPGGETIGQFGEGSKMAALVATRIAGAGAIVFKTPTQVITFDFVDTFGVETLVAQVEQQEGGEGMVCELNLPMIGNIYQGRILRNANYGPTRNARPGAMEVFVKGVYITTLSGDSLWDWNFGNQMSLNRDRSMVSDFDVKFAIGAWLGENMTDEQAKAILFTAESAERDSVHYGKSWSRLRDKLRMAFYELHGDRSCLATGLGSDEKAMKAGWKVVVVNPPNFRDLLALSGVRESHQVLSRSYDMESVDPEQYLSEIQELRRLDSIIKAPAVTVRVFADRGNRLGLADRDENSLWLSEKLFRDGKKNERVATYLHEMAHFISGADDETQEFERALDEIAGCLAMRVLGVMW